MDRIILRWKEPPAVTRWMRSFRYFMPVDWLDILLTIYFVVSWFYNHKPLDLWLAVGINVAFLIRWMLDRVPPTYTIEADGIRRGDWWPRKFLCWDEIEAYFIFLDPSVPGVSRLSFITDPKVMWGETWYFDPQVINEQELLTILAERLPSKLVVSGTESEKRLLSQYDPANVRAAYNKRGM